MAILRAPSALLGISHVVGRAERDAVPLAFNEPEVIALFAAAPASLPTGIQADGTGASFSTLCRVHAKGRFADDSLHAGYRALLR
ncbi:hypothetical protein [Mesorhizobium sp. M0140]|uniref:hypothetical protein n=1 Tax=Mesorhizobium sp. M0140 TaxID=2956893 RepID=UPI0033387B77